MQRFGAILLLGFVVAAAPARAADPAPAAEAKAAAGTEEPAAQFARGLALLEGQGVPKDEAAANGWFRRAAERGHVRSMVNLGISLMKGRGIKRDPGQGVEWLARAAAQNHPRAQVELALAYWNGAGGLRLDRVEAVALLLVAKQNGSPMAKGMLRGYLRELTPPDRKLAHQRARAFRVEHRLFRYDFPEIEQEPEAIAAPSPTPDNDDS